MRGVDTVIHLAAAIRDQPAGSIEELDAMATLRLVRAAEKAGAKRFLFFSAIGASPHSPARFFRAKALAEQAVEEADLETTVVRAVDRLRARTTSGSRCSTGSRGFPSRRSRARATPSTSRSGPRTSPTA